jgi:uncharacterized protein DUF541
MNPFRSLLFLFAIAMLALVPARALAQPVPGQMPGIVATGFGTASEPAQSATLQFLVGFNQFFGMGAPMMESVEIGPGTPETGPAPVIEPSATGRLTEDQLAPIVEALVAAGAAEDAIEIAIPAATDVFGLGGPDAGEIEITVEQPEAALLIGLVAAARDAAPGAGMTILHIGAQYEAADCAALIQQARDLAIADAQKRAEGLATGLGVMLGDLVQASETPYFGLPEAGSCAPEGSEFVFGPYGPGTYPAFDPESTEAAVAVQVTLTYAFGEAA